MGKKIIVFYLVNGDTILQHILLLLGTQTGLQYGFDYAFSLLQLFLLPPFEDYSRNAVSEAMGSFLVGE